jgi:streptogramin lyase
LITAGFGSLWVATQHDWTITRIDPMSNRVTTQVQLETRPSGIVAARDAIWFTAYDEASMATIDPATNRVVGRPIAVGRAPAFILFAENSFWVANALSASVSRVDF